MKTAITLIITAFLSLFPFLATRAQTADVWTSTDGRTITARFVKQQGDTVTVLRGDRELDIPLASLAPESRAFAAYMGAQMRQWAIDNSNTPILDENMLAGILRAAPDAVEGRAYLVEATVNRIDAAFGAGMNSTAPPEITSNTGLIFPADFSTLADGRTTKIGTIQGKITLMKARKLSGGKGWHDFTPEKTLLEPGGTVIVKGTISGGEFLPAGITTEAEATTARLKAAAANGNLSLAQLADLEQIRIRIAFLEKEIESGVKGSATYQGLAIPGGAPTIIQQGTLTQRYTENEITAMQQELQLLKARLAAATR